MGAAFAPRVRGFSECIGRRTRRENSPKAKNKQMKGKIKLMKSRNIIAVLSALVGLTLYQQVQAQETPDPASTCAFCTADGTNALANASAGGGSANSAFGWFSLFSNADASFNTAVGAGSLVFNNGFENTAVGAAALLLNTTGGSNNAVGSTALLNNLDGSFNNAHGHQALNANVSGGENNAFGDRALRDSVGSFNTAFGDDCLLVSVGDGNTALGNNAGSTIFDGSNNLCLGNGAGSGIVSASNQVAINVPAAGPFADISNTCFIGSIFDQPVSDAGTAQDTYVDQFNVLGFLPSSRRVKHDIQSMDKASEAILALKPVTFKYNSDKNGRTQYGLIAEEVAEVAPDLVFRDKNGDVQTVRFEQIGSMLLNEFLKEHKKVQALEATVAQQQKGMEVLTAQLKEQAAQIQKVSAQLEMTKPATKVVAGNQ
jgi:hypothetical protein